MGRFSFNKVSYSSSNLVDDSWFTHLHLDVICVVCVMTWVCNKCQKQFSTPLMFGEHEKTNPSCLDYRLKLKAFGWVSVEESGIPIILDRQTGLPKPKDQQEDFCKKWENK